MGSTWRDRGLPERARAGEPLPAENAPAPAVSRLLALQQGAGNAAVARMLARDGAPPLAAPAPSVTGDEIAALLAELQARLDAAQRASASDEVEASRSSASTAASDQLSALTPKPGVSLAKPLRIVGGALKKAGGALKRWGRKLTGGDKAVPAVLAAPPEAAADAAQLDATIKKLTTMMDDQQADLGALIEGGQEIVSTILDATETSSASTTLRGQHTA